jgi:hypothetical protein
MTSPKPPVGERTEKMEGVKGCWLPPGVRYFGYRNEYVAGTSYRALGFGFWWFHIYKLY